METSLKTGFTQIFSCCPKNLSCPKFGGLQPRPPPLPPPPRTPMSLSLAWESPWSGADTTDGSILLMPGHKIPTERTLTQFYKVKNVFSLHSS